MYCMYEFKYMCMLMNRSVMHNENTKNTIVSTWQFKQMPAV